MYKEKHILNHHTAGHKLSRYLDVYELNTVNCSADKTTGYKGTEVTLIDDAAWNEKFSAWALTGATATGNNIVLNNDVTAQGIYETAKNITYGARTSGNKVSGFIGDQVTITGTPAWNEKTSSYSVTGATVTGNKFTLTGDNVTAEANFETAKNLTLQTDGHGQIASNKMSGFIGDQVTLNNTPSSDCTFSAYTITGANLTGNKFNFIGNDVTAKGNFYRNTHNIIILTSNYGTIATNKSTAYSGDTVTLSNTPAADCHFNSYSITGATLTGSNFKVSTTNVSARGSFSRNVHNLTLQNDGHGTLVASKSTGYSGDTVTLTATPNTNYVFSGYTITGATLTGNSFKFKTNDVTTKAWFSYVSPTKSARIAMRFANIASSYTTGGVTYYPFYLNQKLIVTGYTGDNIQSLLHTITAASGNYYNNPLMGTGSQSYIPVVTASTINFNLVDNVHLYANTGTTTAGCYEIRGRANVNNEIMYVQQYEWSASQWNTHQVNPRNIKDSNNLWIYGRGEGVMTDHIVAGSALLDALNNENIPVIDKFWYTSDYSKVCAPNPIVQHSDIIADITWKE